MCDAALTQAFGLLGKRWNGMILGALMGGPAGFSELRRALGGISDSVLSERLSELTTADLLIREVDPGPPVGVRYRLAPARRGARAGAARPDGLGEGQPAAGRVIRSSQ